MSDTRESIADQLAVSEAPPAAPESAAEAPTAPPPAEAAPLREQQLDKLGRAYATGRRKDAVARVWLKPGSGKIVINGRPVENYFVMEALRNQATQPLTVTVDDFFGGSGFRWAAATGTQASAIVTRMEARI